MTILQAAAKWGVHPNTVALRVVRGLTPATKKSRRTRGGMYWDIPDDAEMPALRRGGVKGVRQPLRHGASEVTVERCMRQIQLVLAGHSETCSMWERLIEQPMRRRQGRRGA